MSGSDLPPDVLTIGQCTALACLLESTAPKPGNVHRGADFADVTYPEFVASGIAIAPVMQAAVGKPLGQTVLEAVTATRRLVASNTNLGTILLLAPLATVPREQPLRQGIAEVLSHLTPDDCRDVYAAIRMATPGGLGRVDNADVSGASPSDLLAAMRLAARRDLVAMQYVNNFVGVLDCAAEWIADELTKKMGLLTAIVNVHLQLMAEFPDSLIARKCGVEVASRSSDWAGRILDLGEPDSEAYQQELADFDFWLRSDGNRRNPGTTADLITAGLFVLLRDGIIKGPLFAA